LNESSRLDSCNQMKLDKQPPKWTSGTFSIGYRLERRLNWCWERTTHRPVLTQFFDRIPRLTRPAVAAPPASPELEAVLKEIENAISAKLYYLAIAVALSIPDICACLEFDPDQPVWQNRKTYAEWCDRNIGGRLHYLSGNDLYNLRGGVLHKGHFGHQQSRFTRVFFLGPEIKLQGAARDDHKRAVSSGTAAGTVDRANLAFRCGRILRYNRYCCSGMGGCQKG
jgi:hypothetical protein